MTLESEFAQFAATTTQLTAAKANIRAEIEALGVPVPASARLEAYDAYIAQIGITTAFLPTIGSVTITPAGGAVGTELVASASNVLGAPVPTLSYQWKRDGAEEPGETAATYAADTAGSISVVITATNSEGFVSLESAAVEVADALPVISAITFDVADPIIGQPITASATATNGGIITWLWPDGTTTAEYTPVPSDDLTTLTVQGTATNSFGTDVDTGTTGTVKFDAPTAEGTVSDFTLEESATAFTLDMKGFFVIPEDTTFVSASWGVTGTGASISTIGILSVTIASARAASPYVVTCTNATSSDTQTFNITVTASAVTAPILSGVTIVGQELQYEIDIADCTIYWLQDNNEERTEAQIEAAAQSFVAASGETEEEITLTADDYFHMVAKRGSLYSNVATAAIDAQAAAAAPVLSAHSVTPGEMTASAVVTTDTGNGILYDLTDQNASRTLAQVKAGRQTFVTSAGEKTLAISGLTVGETYYHHVAQTNSQGTDVVAVDTEEFMTAASAVAINSATTPLSGTGTQKTYTQAAAITDPVGGVLALVHGYGEFGSDTQTVTALTLGGDDMLAGVIKAPESVSSQRCWSAAYWLASPGAGALTLSITTGPNQRAMAITLVDISGIDSWSATVDTLMTSGTGVALGTPQDFYARPLLGGLAFLTASFDTGAMATPTARNSTLLTAGRTGSTGSSDGTYLTSWTDVDNVAHGVAFDSARKATIHRIVGVPA